MTEPPLPSFERRNYTVSDEVAAHLEKLITSGRFTPGDQLPSERSLAASLGVSRTSVRQAVSELAQKELVTRHHGRGTVVASTRPDVESLRDGLLGLNAGARDVSELRWVVEPRVAELAADRALGSNLLQLRTILSVSNEALEAEESLRLDEEFHLQLAHAAQNSLLVTLVERTTSWTHEIRAASHATREGRRVSLAGHQKLYDTIAAKDGKAASEAMIEHLRDVHRMSSGGTAPSALGITF